MKMYMHMLSMLCLLNIRSVNSQGGTTNNTVTIVGPTSFATDGTRLLNLTCQSGTSGNAGYSWTDIDRNPLECGKLDRDSVCTLRPKPEDDGLNVVCEVFTFSDRVLSNASYKLNLQYPPAEATTIQMESSQTEPLQQGDSITCTVSGGKPRVTNITFECQNPDLTGRQNNDRNTSTITVDTSQATADNMTCTCSAHWDPEPALYPKTTAMEFVLEYRANVMSFTVNENTTTTVAESTEVQFWCQGAGRPSPRLILDKHAHDQTIASSTAPEKGLRHTIQSARCEDFGTYTCEANNDFPNPKSKTAQLFVKCAPRVRDESFDRSNLCNLTRVGLNVTVVGYPTPNISVFSLENGRVPDNAFNKRCVRDDTHEHLVHCSVSPDNVSASGCGVYDILIWNEHGNMSLLAEDKHKPQPEDKEQLSVGIILAICVGTLCAIGIGCLITYWMWNKRNQSKQSYGSHPEQDDINAIRSERQHTSQPVIAMVQLQVHSQERQNQISPMSMAEPDYACPFDTLTSAMDAPLVVSFNPNSNSFNSRSDDKPFVVTPQPTENAKKTQDDGFDNYNALGGQGPTPGPDPTYNHIN